MRATKLFVLTSFFVFGCQSLAPEARVPDGGGGTPIDRPGAMAPDAAPACRDCGASDAPDAAVDEGDEYERDAGPPAAEPDADVIDPPAPEQSCESYAAGYYAIRTELDVWWPGTERQIDPGRGTVTVHALAQRVAAADGEPGTTRIKLCGVALPTFTADATCRALALELPDALWDEDAMRWTEQRSDAPSEEGDVLRWSEIVSYAGSDASGGFSDDDGDDQLGVSAVVRADGADYVEPFDSERCSTGSAYGYGRWPVTPGRGKAARRGAARLHVGLAVRASGDALLANECKCSVGQLEQPLLELSVAGCESTLDVEPSDHEDNAHASCSDAELEQLQATLPVLHLLSFGETPGQTAAPRGWTERVPARDIDRRLSQGPRTRFLHLGSDRTDAPSCAEVRTLMLP